MTVYGVTGKNAAQKEALTHLMNPEIDLVVLEGVAGSGKTFIALAAALEQVVETKVYKEILFTRAPVSVGQEIGFLPGTEEEKMKSWCGGFYDNLEDLIGTDERTKKLLERRIKTLAMCFMRGRSFVERYLIIDEVQNISIQHLKVLLTRVGEGTKVVCLGDASQIDNPKLNKDTNGLSMLLKAAITEDFIKVINLPEGVRSRVCSWASKNL